MNQYDSIQRHMLDNAVQNFKKAMKKKKEKTIEYRLVKKGKTLYIKAGEKCI